MQHCVFRADASGTIGFGHVMRCLTLAQLLAEQGHSCHFITRQMPEVLQQKILAAGFVLHWLNAGTESTDAAQTLDVMARIEGSKTLVVDHYGLGLVWERQLRSVLKRLMVIDDLAARPHDCDVLLDQNLGRTVADYQSLVPASCRILTGTHFTLLRPEFAQKRSESVGKRVSDPVQSVLINLGGGDQLPLLGEILRSLSAHFQVLTLNITIVTGQPLDDKALKTASDIPECWVLQWLSNIDHMAELLAKADLAIGAAGSSAWERCCLGVPSIMWVLADNQRVIAETLAEQGAARVVETLDALVDAFRELLDPAVRQVLHERSLSLCDGLGAQRVVAALLA